jgi:hypothetical protein
MKKFIWAAAVVLAVTICYAFGLHAEHFNHSPRPAAYHEALSGAPPPTSQTVNYSPAREATSYTFFTNDEQYPTTLQRLNYYYCIADPVYAPALHISTSPVTINDFTFAPGYNYTLQILGTATVSGDLSTPPADLTFAVALWPATPMSNVDLALNPFANAYAMETYPGSMPPSLYWNCFGYRSTDDFYGNWLTSFSAIGTIAMTPTQGFSITTPKFVATSTTNQLTIELGPVLGDAPTLDDLTYGNCGCLNNPIYLPTNAVLSINQITITSTPIQAAQINGSSQFYFSSSISSGGGTITDAPGATVTVTVTGSGAPGGNYTTECNISGATFSTGSASLLATNTSNTATFIMPASGSVTWTGNYSYTASEGGGSISVH